MGLDTFAAKSEGETDLTVKDLAAFEKEDIQLAEYDLSFGSASFRGKIYAPLVDQITGVSLYNLYIYPEVVYDMWKSFEKTDPNTVAVKPYWTKSQNVEAIQQLKKFFKVCADCKLGLYGSF